LILKQDVFADKFETFFEKDTFGQETDFFGKQDFGKTFGSNDGISKNNNINNNSKSSKTEKFDPFGLSETAFKGASFDHGYGIETDFANFDSFNNNDIAASTNGNGLKGGNAWGDAKSTTRIGKVKKFNKEASNVSKITKFTSDYSENYETDLEQVLKRSMVDQ
jgi:hypothetical protein